MKRIIILALAGLTLFAACDRVSLETTKSEKSTISVKVPADAWLADFAAAQRLDELGGGAEDSERFAEAGA